MSAAHAVAEAFPVAVPEYRHPVLADLVRYADVAAVGLASVAAPGLQPHLQPPTAGHLVDVADLIGLLAFALAPKRDALLRLPAFFSPARCLRYLLPPICFAALAMVIVGLAAGWPPGRSTVAAAVWAGSCAATLALLRGAMFGALTGRRGRSWLSHRVAIIGSGIRAQRIAQYFPTSAMAGFSLIGLFDHAEPAQDGTAPAGSVSDLVRISRRDRLHSIIIAIPPDGNHPERVAALAWQLRGVHADVYVLPELMHGRDAASPMTTLGPLHLTTLQRRPLSERQMAAKATLDFVLAAVLLLLLSPVLAVVALAIKSESEGPVLFRQPRQGLNNEYFTVFKFRSMYAHASDHAAARQTSRGDPRVTRCGRWLRRLSIDELPQLLNVLRGEMSLVGPRPHAAETRAGGLLLDDGLSEYVIRHQVKPGITGWAQVNGSRGELVTLDDLQRRVTLDLEYMQRWSIWFDLRIMALTALREIASRHAC